MGDYCEHGLRQRLDIGVDRQADGVEICRSCGKPTFESARAVETGTVEPEPGPVLVVTMNDVPGYRVDEVHGDVSGVSVLARNAFSNFGASLRTVVGGEVGGYTTLVVDARSEARDRMVTQARSLGANAVLAMRIECSDLGDIMSQLAAYGTAVTISKLESVAIG